MFVPTIIALIPLTAAFLCGILTIQALRMRSGIEKPRTVILFYSLTCYTLGAALELCSTDISEALFWAKIEYFGIALASPCWVALVIAYAGYESAGSKRLILTLFIVPAITIGIAISPLMIPFLYLSASLNFSGLAPVMQIVPGPWYWINITYNIVMMLTGTAILLQMFLRSSRFFRSQISLMLLGSCVPFIALLLNITGHQPVPGLDLTPFALVITGLTIYNAVTRHQFMDILPVAHSMILRDIPVGLIVLDSLNRIREINPAAGEILRVSPQRMIGMHVAAVLPAWSEIADHLTGPECQYELRTGSPISGEVYVVSRIFLDHAHDFHTGSILLFSNITARIRAEEKERRRTSELVTLLDTLPGYVYYKDTLGNFISANQRFCELFEVSGSIEGRSDNDIIPVELDRQIRELEGTILAGDREEAEFEGAIPSGDHEIIVSGKIVAYRDDDGAIAGLIGLGYDITARKNQEARVMEYSEIIKARNQELVALQDQLEVVNRDLDHQVRQRTQEVEALLIQRDHFIEQLGHDLRTPLIPLVGLVPFLIDQETDPDIARLLSQMKTSVDVMQNMVEQILHLARLNSMYSITDRETYDLRDLIATVIASLTPEAEMREISISHEVQPGLLIQLSPVHAPIIFKHVLSNAIRYNLQGGAVIITADQDSEGLVIAVKDTGMGIEETDLLRIFDEFYRSDRSRQSLEAKGLGLAIVRRMVTLNGGKIWAHSDGPSTGSTFFIRFYQTGKPSV